MACRAHFDCSCGPDEICSFHSQEDDSRLGLEFPVTGQPADQKEALAHWEAGSLLCATGKQAHSCVPITCNGKFCFSCVKTNSCLVYLVFRFAFLVGDADLSIRRLKELNLGVPSVYVPYIVALKLRTVTINYL